ncbi:MAG: hypothetical protein JWM38_1298, partial [Sphingomonas bacterium]|nr:hypothetical protein [Sphingomonas bacterium]
IAEVEALSPRTHFQDVPLDQLVEELVETYRPDMEASGHLLVTAIAPAIWTTGDRRLLQQLITNLLDNALRHTPPGTTVRVQLERDGAIARLTVSDDGQGVAPEDATRLFQRFARAEHSRSSEGHGLGLALVAAVATAHGGIVSLLAPPGFGVAVELPVRRND